MSPDERKMFLDRFTEINPHWRGAHVADVLDVLADSDSHLEVVEGFHEEHPVEMADGYGGFCTLAIIYAYGDFNPPWEWVDKLLKKVRLEVAAKELRERKAR